MKIGFILIFASAAITFLVSLIVSGLSSRNTNVHNATKYVDAVLEAVKFCPDTAIEINKSGSGPNSPLRPESEYFSDGIEREVDREPDCSSPESRIMEIRRYAGGRL